MSNANNPSVKVIQHRKGSRTCNFRQAIKWMSMLEGKFFIALSIDSTPPSFPAKALLKSTKLKLATNISEHL